MTQAGAAAEVADVRARIASEVASAAALYRRAMLPAALPDRIMVALRLPSGWVRLKGAAGPEINAPRYAARGG